MENNKDIIIRILIGLIIIFGLTIVAIKKPHNVSPPLTEKKVCKEDSLQKVITQLQIDLEGEEDGWDIKENRYEDIIHEYEFGVDYLEKYHPNAYKDFHRIIGFKERYTHGIERENKQRLQTSDKW